MIWEEVSVAVTILSKTGGGTVLSAHASDHGQTGSLPAFRTGVRSLLSCDRRFSLSKTPMSQDLSWTRVTRSRSREASVPGAAADANCQTRYPGDFLPFHVYPSAAAVADRFIQSR